MRMIGAAAAILLAASIGARAEMEATERTSTYWSVTEDVIPTTDVRIYYASLFSKNSQLISAATQETGRMFMMVTDHLPNAVFLRVGHGQVSCGERCEVSIRFDEEDAMVLIAQSSDAGTLLVYLDRDVRDRLLHDHATLEVRMPILDKEPQLYQFVLRPIDHDSFRP